MDQSAEDDKESENNIYLCVLNDNNTHENGRVMGRNLEQQIEISQTSKLY